MDIKYMSADPGSELDPGMNVSPSLLTVLINYFEQIFEMIKAFFTPEIQPR